MESVVCHGRSASCICCRTWQMRMSRLSWRAWRTSLHKIKAMFSICTCTCMYMYHIKTGDMKCLHSFICLCVIRLDRYYERFKQMTDLSPGVGYGRAPLMMWISNKKHYAYNDNDNENILFDHFFVTKKDIIQNKCHIYRSYRLVWRLLLRQITLSLS